jgi:hypothetical protein
VVRRHLCSSSSSSCNNANVEDPWPASFLSVQPSPCMSLGGPFWHIGESHGPFGPWRSIYIHTSSEAHFTYSVLTALCLSTKYVRTYVCRYTMVLDIVSPVVFPSLSLSLCLLPAVEKGGKGRQRQEQGCTRVRPMDDAFARFGSKQRCQGTPGRRPTPLHLS